MEKKITQELQKVSNFPGVYIMKNTEGKIIYIGKAKNLKKRVSSYFKKNHYEDLKTSILVGHIKSFETIITTTEKEALILESGLIKKHKPKYNIILKDGKQYPLLKIDTNCKYPNITIVRKRKNDRAIYFGPFTSSLSVRQTLKMIFKTFKIRKCKTANLTKKLRPCINYQMKTCMAPCFYDINSNNYDKIVKEVVLFLQGKIPSLIADLNQEMITASRNMEYEQAAVLRDKIFALKKTLEKQIVVSKDFVNRDVFAIKGSFNYYLITMLTIRNGCLVGTYFFDFSETFSDKFETLSSFIKQYYEKTIFIPKEIIIPFNLLDVTLIKDDLANKKGSKVNIIFPKQGEKLKILSMAIKNCELEYEKRISAEIQNKKLLIRLQKILKADRLPIRIECFDNSNFSGKDPVSAMVVFENGNKLTSAYRKYKLKSNNNSDDYAYMAEVLKRRFKPKVKKSEVLPDLLVVDGGKGQLNIAVSILKDFGIFGKIEVIGIAKKDEKKFEKSDKVFKFGRSNPINFIKDEDLLLFLQKIRDESHRFVINFQKNIRNKKLKKSVLDTIPLIGPKKKEILLKHFKSIKKIKDAKSEELENLPGINEKLAKTISSVLSNIDDI